MTITPAEYLRCREFAKRLVGMAADGRWRASLSVRGSQHDEVLQCWAKCAEVAFCRAAAGDPASIDWDATGRDWDVRVGQLRVDVKHTVLGHMLIWPATKAAKLPSTDIDVLALIKGCERSYVAVGWMPKAEFMARSRTAVAGRGGLDPGTLYVTEDELRPMGELPRGDMKRFTIGDLRGENHG